MCTHTYIHTHTYTHMHTHIHTHTHVHTHTHSQGAIVGVNVFYFFRIMRGSEGTSHPGGGYASFPEPTGPSEGGAGSSDYTPPEY